MKICNAGKKNLLHAMKGTKHHAHQMGVANIKTFFILVKSQPKR